MTQSISVPPFSRAPALSSAQLSAAPRKDPLTLLAVEALGHYTQACQVINERSVRKVAAKVVVDAALPQSIIWGEYDHSVGQRLFEENSFTKTIRASIKDARTHECPQTLKGAKQELVANVIKHGFPLSSIRTVLAILRVSQKVDETKLSLAQSYFDEGARVADEVRALLEPRIQQIAAFYGRGFLSQMKDDLAQEGRLVIERAILHFAPDAGTSFLTYGSFWIRQTNQIYTKNHSTTVRQPVWLHKLRAKIQKDAQTEHATSGRDLSLEELLSRQGKDPTNETLKVSLGQKAMSIDTPSREDDDLSWAATLPAKPADPGSISAEKELGSLVSWVVRDAVRLLDDRERSILTGRIAGGESGSPETLKELGQKYGITAERVRQLEYRSLRKVQKYVERELRAHGIEEADLFDSPLRLMGIKSLLRC